MIKNVTIVGGTHGNEYSGIYLLRKWRETPELISRGGLNVSTLMANPNAFRDNRRYLDSDLNRQFLSSLLEDDGLGNYEQSRAKVINQEIGPKGRAKTDFIIDLHNTTSNMGPSLILLQSDRFNRQLAAYVLSKMQDVVVVFEDEVPVSEHPYLCSVAEQGVIVEIGPQPQSVLREDILAWMEEMTGHILDFLVLFNTDAVPSLPTEIEAYKYTETLKLPEDKDGNRLGMVHRNIQDNDFEPLYPGDPIFTLFNGEEIHWDGEQIAYPHFINEAAYYDNNLAFSLAAKVRVEVYGDSPIEVIAQ